MDYSSTVLLPKTDFPMRADLPKREPALVEQWSRQMAYQALLKAREGAPAYHLHDGPPFANGDAHVGPRAEYSSEGFGPEKPFDDGLLCAFCPGLGLSRTTD